MLKSSEVEAVIICTPPTLHKPMFIDALEAGKHVFVEKPVAMSIDEITEMMEAKKKFPHLKTSACSARHARLQPKFRKVKEIIDSGALGEIYFMHHNCVWRQARPGIEYHPAAKWFLNRKISGGGPLFDWGVYDLSFHLGVLSDQPELKKIQSVFLKNGLDLVDPGTDIFDVEEHFAANLELSNGLHFYWERSTNANMHEDNQTRIYGTKGGLKFGFCSWDPPSIEFFDVKDEGKGEARSEVIQLDMDAHEDDELELSKHFINVLEDVEKPAMPIELEAKHLDIIFKLYKEAGV
jgi:predicted dehydrogenase